ncbi:hypothetical protein DCAR_0414518 [Daucus carota subsp. sativus]|uniref:Uncharacterized protein n=1 Tax=Daucus carota subsp. sativus TaxID=79200 RepID=A0A175YBP1_DAUCS|nr:hypothetical protein DCAR_0414518 [Daucus carota subsp. sativus]
MVVDLIPPSSYSKDMMKKKRSKKTDRLKQSKLDARKKQWVSQDIFFISKNVMVYDF